MARFTFLTKKIDVSKAQARLLKKLRAGEHVIGTIGYPGGSYRTTIYNLTEHGFWFGGGMPTGTISHYWNCFGLGTMKAGASRNIMCEINPPTSGVSGLCGGVFIANEHGKVALASRGRLGGGKAGVGRKNFEKFYRDGWIQAFREDEIHKLVLIDYLDSPNLAARLGDYIFAVAKIKGKITGAVDPDATAAASLLANAAATGNTAGLTRGQKEGLKKLKKSWVYERSAKNRRIALARWGNACAVCDLRFDDRYGQKLARGFIEFHHLHPVSLGLRTTNPAKDLRPLCSNCHSMAHKDRPIPVPIGKLRRLLSQGT
jgi:hypothetical protein